MKLAACFVCQKVGHKAEDCELKCEVEGCWQAAATCTWHSEGSMAAGVKGKKKNVFLEKIKLARQKSAKKKGAASSSRVQVESEEDSDSEEEEEALARVSFAEPGES